MTKITLKPGEIAPIKQFTKYEDFVLNMNNFYIHFTNLKEENSPFKVFRQKPCFLRFKNNEIELEKRLTNSITNLTKKKSNYENTKEFRKALPKELFNAYIIMSNLVSINDPDVMDFDNNVNENYLTE
jgi:hypothetical protein